MSVLLKLVTYLCVFVYANEAARILAVFPTPSVSHQVVFRPLTQALAKRGHEVIVITTDPAFPKGGVPSNLTEIDMHDISYKTWKDKLLESARGNENDLLAQMHALMDTVTLVAELQITDKQVQKILQDKKQKFDLIITEASVWSALIYSYVYKAPTIQFSSMDVFADSFEIFGAPVHPLLFPCMLRQRLNSLSQWEKITELFKHNVILGVFNRAKSVDHAMLKKHYGDDLPSMEELIKNVHMLFLNVNPVFQGIRPVPPNVIYLGGLHQKPEKELPTDLKSYLDSSKNGVIYISFGTNVDPTILPPERIQILVNTVSKLPYNVLWKWNKDELPGRTDNIKISKWLPQSDLLKHPNIKLFVTQGGLQSTDEAITAGVPLIGMPMLGDQWFNVEKYEYHGIGIRLDFDNLTVEKFTAAINKIIKDDSYRRNIVKLRELMADEPMKPLDRAVWWTEYVIRHGGAKHLQSPAASISWTEYLELELVFTIVGFLLAIVTLVIVILRRVYIVVTKKNSDKFKRS
ncbi:UDP-glycosyltransferase UGT5-like [Anticarsia gemmatalis]|uniref:UDP-glycosyltransferase UGT5-like n=1 Tax=Anticarsia gemmatalis TaxID=129554 RepID=UPI003F7609EE